jgi:TrmH family RNA methyltransferase
VISSEQNAKVRYARRLGADRRYRLAQGRMVLEGVRLVESALEALGTPELTLVSDDLERTERGRVLTGALKAAGGPILRLTPGALAAAADTATPQGVVSVFPVPPARWPEAPTLALALDGLRDPVNVGAAARSAVAAGAEAIALLPGTTDAFSPKSLRAGMGAQLLLPVIAASWEELDRLAPGLTTVVADAGGQLAYTEYDWRAPTLLVLGAEADGPSPASLERAKVVVTIPMAGPVESLNAAAAAAVLLFEAARQRGGGRADR